MAHTDAEERAVARELTAELEAEQEDRVMRARRELHLRVTNAGRELARAVQELRKLSSNDAFDVEYEGGSPFADHLHEAQRVLVIAAALIPTNAEGEMREDTQGLDTYHALTQGSHISK
jgi:hypothetical protein